MIMAKNIKKGKLLSWLLAVAVVLTMTPAMAFVGSAEAYAEEIPFVETDTAAAPNMSSAGTQEPVSYQEPTFIDADHPEKGIDPEVLRSHIFRWPK